MPIINSFSDNFENLPSKLNSQNLQTGDSGISDLFSKLLYTDWNIRNYKSVTGIFNSINRDEIYHSNKRRLF